VNTDTTTIQAPTLQAVTLDLYRDVHKGIRSELFAVTEQAGRLDPADDAGRADLARQVNGVVRLLGEHAEHEDGAIGPALVDHLPELAELIARDHHVLEARLAHLDAWAAAAADAAPGRRRAELHALYAELASFTGAYLAHQDLEERVVMPALEAAIGVPAVVAVHEAIVGGMPPEELARGLAVMLPAMNVDDRAEMLGGIKSSAPAEAFAQVWGLAGSVLAPADHRAVARRLGVEVAA
jgi:hypothetical protein